MMDEAMIREAAKALSARLRALLDESMAREIVLSRDDVLLAQGFAESVADLLTPEVSRSDGPSRQ